MHEHPNRVSSWVLGQWNRENDACNNEHITVQNKVTIRLDKLVQLNQLRLGVVEEGHVGEHCSSDVQNCAWYDRAVNN